MRSRTRRSEQRRGGLPILWANDRSRACRCVPVVVNLVPLGGRVELRAKQSDEFNVSFHDLHPALRIGVFATGSLAIVAVAVACLGPIEGLHSVWRGFRQIFREEWHRLRWVPHSSGRCSV